MNVGELRELIKDLPDETPVVECRDGNACLWTDRADIGVGQVHLGTRWHSFYKKDIPTEWNEVAVMSTITHSYDALIFKSEE